MKSIILFSTGEERTPLIPHTISHHRVLSSQQLSPRSGKQECWLIEYDNGEIADPSSDPMIIGATDDSSIPRVVWNNQIWTPASQGQMETLAVLAEGMRPKSSVGRKM